VHNTPAGPNKSLCIRDVHGSAAAAATDFLINHRGSGVAATGFLKFIAVAAR
jgi:hypothetical protein